MAISENGTSLRRKVRLRSPLAPDQLGRLTLWGAPVLLGLVLFCVYLSGLHPGVDAGDSAELQYSCPLLGICHPPGYQIEVTVGRLFCMLPIGSSIAWRLNLLMAICGVVGCLALYGSVLQITGRIVPAICAAGILGFSTIFWSHCLVAEAYVFYATFLLLGMYTAVRLVQENQRSWLYLSALLVGISVGDRPSELCIVPAFLLLWFAFRKRVRVAWKHALVALALFLLPFAFSVGCYLIRNDPAKLGVRDDALRDEIIVDTSAEISRGYGPGASAFHKVQHAAAYCLGLVWIEKSGFTAEGVSRTLDSYTWLLSGLGAVVGRSRLDRPVTGGRGGASIGLLGLLLAIAGTVVSQRRLGWVLFGWGLFAGNLLFILWHHAWDNLTFTIPGLAGLALLAGLGIAGAWERTGRGGWLALWRAGALAAPLFLLLSNYALVARNGPQDNESLHWGRNVAAAPWPERSVILCSYWPATTLRYLLYLEAKRTDACVICASETNWDRLIRHFEGLGRPVFVFSDTQSGLEGRTLPGGRAGPPDSTPPPLARLGFARAFPRR